LALQATVKASLSATLTAAADLAAPNAKIADAIDILFTDGTGLGQADRIWQDTRTLPASATEDLDLSGALTNALGATAIFARIKAILVKAAAGNTNNVNVTRAAAGVPLFLATGDGLPVKPGGAFLWVAPDATGIAVTATTADTLTLTNSAGATSVTYDILILGCNT
jgi:hypothetical protein